MPIITRRQRAVDQALIHLDEHVLSIEAIDGFLAALALFPAELPASAWLAIIWGQDEAPESPFESAADEAYLSAQVSGLAEATARALFAEPMRYAPLIPHDPRHDEYLWELWMEGFARAALLHADAALALAREDSEAGFAFQELITLIDIAERTSDLPKEDQEAITGAAHRRIPALIETLRDWRRDQPEPLPNMVTEPRPPDPLDELVEIPSLYAQPTARRPSPGEAAPPPSKPGRNDPCACGSGQKYKKCCGA